jgi:adenylate kinase
MRAELGRASPFSSVVAANDHGISDYNLISHGPAMADVCDVCGGRLVARTDDTAEAVRARLRDYHAKTRPVLDLFRAKELVAVDTTHPAEHVQAELRRRLGVG